MASESFLKLPADPFVIATYPTLTHKEARQKIKKMLDKTNVMINVNPVSITELTDALQELPESAHTAAIHEGMVWALCYVDTSSDTGAIQHGKPVVIDTVTGRAVTGIHTSWGDDEYKIVGTAWKSFSGPGWGEIPITLTPPSRGGAAIQPPETQARFILFISTSNLGNSEMNVDVIRYWNGTNPGSTTKVYDPTNSFRRALTESMGIAVWDDVNEEYLILFCHTKAGRIRFTLTGGFGSGSSGFATVNAYSGRGLDIQNPIPGGTTLQVFDDAGLFPRAPAGAKGEAELDVVGNRYIVRACQTRAKQIYFSLVNPLDTTMDAGSGTMLSSWDGVAPSNPVTLRNMETHTAGTYLFHGDPGWRGYADYDHTLDQYVIKQMECGT